MKTNCLGEEGVQYPISGNSCVQFDCSQYPLNPLFLADKYTVDLATQTGEVNFINYSENTTNREWLFGDGSVAYTDSIVSHTYTSTGTYQVQLITYNSVCSDTSTLIIEVINSLGTNEMLKNNNLITVYPNPTTNLVNINYEVNTADAFTVTIVDLQGKEVYTNTLYNNKGQLQINLNEWSDGVYFVNLITNQNVKTVKLIVAK